MTTNPFEQWEGEFDPSPVSPTELDANHAQRDEDVLQLLEDAIGWIAENPDVRIRALSDAIDQQAVIDSAEDILRGAATPQDET